MGLLLDLLTAPVLGVPRMVHWLAKKVAEEAEQELFNEEKVRAQLLELQTRYELGEIAEEEYKRQEDMLIKRLNAIRKAQG